MESLNSFGNASGDNRCVTELSQRADSFAFRFLNEFVVITAEDGTIQYISPNSLGVLGVTSLEGKEGLPFDEVFGWEPAGFPQSGSQPVSIVKTLAFEGNETGLNITMRSVQSEFGTRMFTFSLADANGQNRSAERRGERYRQLFEGLKDGYFFLGADSEGTVVYVSPSVENILGFRPEDIVGRPWKQFVDLEENAHVTVLEQKRFSTNDVESKDNFSFECSVAHLNGSIRRFKIRDVPVIDENGVVVGSEALCHDITEQRIFDEQQKNINHQLKQTLEQQTQQLSHIEGRYQSVAEYHSDFVVRWLPSGIRTFVNPAYCKYVGSAAEELVGTPLPRIVDSATSQDFQREISMMSPSNPVSSNEVCITRKDGSKVWQHWIDHGLFNSDNQLVEVQSVGRDVTEQRRLERLERSCADFRALMDTLSPRERQVMDLVASGKANKVIARILDLSVKTVEKHRSSMMRKLKVQSVAELVRGVIQSERLSD